MRCEVPAVPPSTALCPTALTPHGSAPRPDSTGARGAARLPPPADSPLLLGLLVFCFYTDLLSGLIFSSVGALRIPQGILPLPFPPEGLFAVPSHRQERWAPAAAAALPARLVTPSAWHSASPRSHPAPRGLPSTRCCPHPQRRHPIAPLSTALPDRSLFSLPGEKNSRRGQRIGCVETKPSMTQNAASPPPPQLCSQVRWKFLSVLKLRVE